MREWMRGKRRYSRVGVSIAGFQFGLYRLVSLEAVAVANDRRSELESRLSAHADDRRSCVVHEQSEPHVSREQRRAESAHGVDFAVGEQRTHWMGRAVRPGTVDARPDHAAGRG